MIPWHASTLLGLRLAACPCLAMRVFERPAPFGAFPPSGGAHGHGHMGRRLPRPTGLRPPRGRGQLRTGNEDLLEATLERRVLLDVLPVPVERGRADEAQRAVRERRLEQVLLAGHHGTWWLKAGSPRRSGRLGQLLKPPPHASKLFRTRSGMGARGLSLDGAVSLGGQFQPAGRAVSQAVRAHHRVDLVDEEDDLARPALQLPQHHLQPKGLDRSVRGGQWHGKSGAHAPP